MSDETGSQTSARLLEVIAHADFEVLRAGPPARADGRGDCGQGLVLDHAFRA